MTNEPLPYEPEELDAELVAYLDGELDPEESRRIDALLARDETARARLRSLERAWEALDELPRAAVDEKFTRSTVEMIALQAETDIDELEAGLPRRRRLRRSAAIAGVAAAMLAGFFVFYRAWPDPNRQLVEDLPVLEHLDAYSQVQDISFLRELAKQELFAVERPNAR